MEQNAPSRTPHISNTDGMSSTYPFARSRSGRASDGSIGVTLPSVFEAGHRNPRGGPERKCVAPTEAYTKSNRWLATHAPHWLADERLLLYLMEYDAETLYADRISSAERETESDRISRLKSRAIRDRAAARGTSEEEELLRFNLEKEDFRARKERRRQRKQRERRRERKQRERNEREEQEWMRADQYTTASDEDEQAALDVAEILVNMSYS